MQIIDCTPAVATAFAYDQRADSYHVLSDYRPSADSQAYTASQPIANPLQAWTSYAELTDCLMRRRIGSALEKQGKNRFTGEEDTAT